ncbi:unnamed protein product [Diatraea saccharalis]|uniref:C2H2-type domain-containing protein n=1 Tax=Diatraea saccharalis TaxID=40085 RepID=A0A9N9R5C3_9NEOP|nr:unnamed protein product [Diatraea saccharalis]
MRNSDIATETELREIYKHHSNLNIIRQCSNATPIRSRGGIGYTCCYCTDEYPNPEDLKSHTLKHHVAGSALRWIAKEMNKIYSYVIKLDITALKCNICDTGFDSLDDFVYHLITDHDKKIYTDLDDRIIPLKFEDKLLSCVFCSQAFNKFKTLMQHMNIHYRNFVCDVCNAGFPTPHLLNNHSFTHKKGEFGCIFCDKVFDTLRKQKAHEKAIHKQVCRNICGFCYEKFRDHKKKEEHLTEVHGVTIIGMQCQACSKTFPNRKLYTIHMKRDHLLERKHQCVECDKAFFRMTDLKKHMLKHTGERKYQCSVCKKSYGRNTTLTQHMKIHANIRKYKCSADTTSENVSHNPLKPRPAKRKSDISTDTDIREIYKHHSNLNTIRQCSNATPIRSRGGIGYTCAYCTVQYPDPADLKSHTLEHHKAESAPKWMAKEMNVIYSYFVKLDITALKCNICDTGFDSLDDFVYHLIIDHKKNIYTDVDDRIISFKFEEKLLSCVFCSQAFNKFKSLMQHMNIHYSNFVCEVCNAGFVTRQLLYSHSFTHKKGEFECTFCDKIFDTSMKQRSHENIIHKQTSWNKCGFCNEKFRDHRKKEKHLAEMHGVAMVEMKCQACSKTFPNRKRYTIHMKRDHLLERKHQCDKCDKAFFRTTDLKKHMLKHTGERKYQCSVCNKSYGRNTTLTEHMKIHANIRKYKCEYCDQKFIQKCTWKGHLKAKHNVVLQ